MPSLPLLVGWQVVNKKAKSEPHSSFVYLINGHTVVGLKTGQSILNQPMINQLTVTKRF